MHIRKLFLNDIYVLHVYFSQGLNASRSDANQLETIYFAEEAASTSGMRPNWTHPHMLYTSILVWVGVSFIIHFYVSTCLSYWYSLVGSLVSFRSCMSRGLYTSSFMHCLCSLGWHSHSHHLMFFLTSIAISRARALSLVASCLHRVSFCSGL